jgi:hypothetical protein
MKFTIFMVVVGSLLVLPKHSDAQNKDPELLKEPAGWTFEKFQLPPVFAPSFPFHGFEELRFSPGMFTKTAHDYFTYAFAASLDHTTTFTKADLARYLDLYFKGLCFATARDRKLTVDTSQIKVRVLGQNNKYTAIANIFGVFADGAPVTLNMEIKVIPDTPASKTFLVFIASPNPATDEVWKQLHAISNSFMAGGKP